jgi:hypothetical protein
MSEAADEAVAASVDPSAIRGLANIMMRISERLTQAILIAVHTRPTACPLDPSIGRLLL